MKKLKKALVITFAVVLVLQIILALAATPVLRKVLRSTVDTGTKLERIYINLFGGTITLRGLEIDQPDGYDEEPFLELGYAKINLTMGKLLAGKVHVEDITLDRLRVTVIIDSNAVVNTTRLITAPTNGTTEATGIPEQPDAAGQPFITIAKAEARNVSYTFEDRSQVKPVSMNLREAEFRLQDIAINPPGSKHHQALTSNARMTGQLFYPDKPTAFVDITGKLAPVYIGETPTLIAGAAITGIELDAAGSMIAPGVRTAVGGEVIDALIQLQLATNLLDFVASIETAGASLPIHVGGTLEEPVVYVGTALLGAFSRIANLFGHSAANLTGAGLAVGKGVVDITTSVGKNTLDMAAGVGGGLLKTVQGVATLNVKDVGDGLLDSVKSVGQGAVDTVADAGRATTDTFAEATGSATGQKRANAWSENKRDRHDKNWTSTMAWVDSIDYPAATESTSSDDQSPNSTSSDHSTEAADGER